MKIEDFRVIKIKWKKIKKGVDLCLDIVHNKSSSSETAANKNKVNTLINKKTMNFENKIVTTIKPVDSKKSYL